MDVETVTEVAAGRLENGSIESRILGVCRVIEAVETVACVATVAGGIDKTGLTCPLLRMPKMDPMFEFVVLIRQYSYPDSQEMGPVCSYHPYH